MVYTQPLTMLEEYPGCGIACLDVQTRKIKVPLSWSLVRYWIANEFPCYHDPLVSHTQFSYPIPVPLVSCQYLCSQLLIPRSKPMPRSTSMARSKPKPNYLLNSSLMFHHNQAPISITAKCPCPATIPINLPSSAKASLITHALHIISTTGNKAAAFHPSAHAPWQPEVNCLGRCKISYILLLVDIYAQHIYLCFI